MELFLDLMTAYYSGKAFQNITLDEEKDCYYGKICIKYDKSSDSLQVVNPFAHLISSKNIKALRRAEVARRQVRRYD